MRLCAMVLMLATGLGISQAGHATTVIMISIPEVLESSDIVFEGTLDDIKIVYNDQDPRISTEYKFKAMKVYKGEQNEAEVILRIPGGSDGLYEVAIDGMPHFEKSDIGKNFIVAAEVVQSDGKKRYLPYGLTQGIFWNSDDKKLIYRNIEGSRMYLNPVCVGGEEEEEFDAYEFYFWLERTKIMRL